MNKCELWFVFQLKFENNLKNEKFLARKLILCVISRNPLRWWLRHRKIYFST